MQDWNKMLPVVGMVTGTTLGALSTLFTTQSLNTKAQPDGLICSSMDAFGISQLNDIKQWEIRGPALLTPVVLLAGNLVFRLMQPGEKTLQQKLIKEVKSFSLGKIIAGIGFFAASFFANHLIKPYTPGMDVSGHVFIKGATSFFLVIALEYMSKSAISYTVGLSVVASEALFIFKTAACHHTVNEVVIALVTSVAMGKLATTSADIIDAGLKMFI